MQIRSSFWWQAYRQWGRLSKYTLRQRRLSGLCLFILPLFHVLVLLVDLLEVFSGKVPEKVEELDEVARDSVRELAVLVTAACEKVVPAKTARLVEMLEDGVGR